MKDQSKTKQVLIQELTSLRQRIAALEQSDSEHKQAEEALLESEGRFRLLADTTPVLIWMSEPDKGCTYFNRAWLEFTGRSLEQEFGNGWSDGVHPEDLQRCQDIYVSHFDARREFLMEYRLRRADGEFRLVRDNGVPRFDGEGSFLGYVGSCVDITDYKQAEEMLQKVNENVNALIEAIPDTIFFKDGESRWRVTNEAAKKLFKLHGFKWEGKSERELSNTRPEFRNAHELCLINDEKAWDAGTLTILSEDMIGEDGKVHNFEVRKMPLFEPNGRRKALVIIGRDITERKQTEEKLQESEAKFRTLFESANDAIFLMDQDIIIDCNLKALEMLGCAREQIIGQTPHRFSPEVQPDGRKSAEKVQQKIETVFKGQVQFFEWKHSRYDGSLFDAEVSLNMFIVEGKYYLLAIVRNISERKQTEEAIRESEERFRAFSENAPDIIYNMNLDGTISYVNPSWKRFLGHGEEDLLGHYFTDFAKKEDRRAYRKLFKGIRDEGKTVINYIGVMLTKDGAERVFNMTSTLNRGSEGRIIGVVGTMKDITELRDMEMKLSHAQKMEAVGTLASGIAHDFNNLLMGIQGYASLSLMNLDSSHPNYERLKRIEEQVQSGADLTKQLLGFARGGRYQVKPTDMNDILEKSSSMFGRTKKEISIHRKYGKCLWSVEVDRGQMEQVFMNLYVNAWQAMPGGGEIYLETENFLLDNEQAFPYAVKAGRYIKISMTDTGTGMDAKIQVRIFDPFFTTKVMGQGTGLGLAMVYGIIKGHEGMIDVSSEPGHGTTFTIYLPASEKELVKEKTATGTIARGTETILLVDDEKMVMEVNKELLESMGYRIYAAGNGQEAIAVYMEKRNEIDLVILDMIMPGISGGETFDRLREINSEVKVLLSSGYGINGQAQEILDRGCNGYLQKPFRPEKLFSTVREMLD